MSARDRDKQDSSNFGPLTLEEPGAVWSDEISAPPALIRGDARLLESLARAWGADLATWGTVVDSRPSFVVGAEV